MHAPSASRNSIQSGCHAPNLNPGALSRLARSVPEAHALLNELAAEGAESAELDEVITDVWNSGNQVWLQHAAAPIRRWSNSRYPFKQAGPRLG